VDQNVTDYLLQELLPAFEDLDAQSAAILSFLKDRGIATDEALKPYLEQAGMASSVKWRAVRARLAHLLAPPPKAATEVAKKEPETPKEEASKADNETKAGKPSADQGPKDSAQGESKPDAKAEFKPTKSKSVAEPTTDEEQKTGEDQAKTTEEASDRERDQHEESEDRSKDGQRSQQQGQKEAADKGEDRKGEKAAEESKPRESAARKG
jgi:hypothetical protein